MVGNERIREAVRVARDDDIDLAVRFILKQRRIRRRRTDVIARVNDERAIRGAGCGRTQVGREDRSASWPALDLPFAAKAAHGNR
jgi:hypothetical protein